MQVVRVDRPGGYDRLRLVETTEPTCGAGQIKIGVAAAGINFADLLVRMGLYRSSRTYVGWPVTPGFEVAGTVREVGPGVERYAVGDRVFGVTRFGGYASVVVTSEQHVRPLPAEWSAAEGAGFPAVFLTAWYALCELCRIRPGGRLLVHSAAGGVGGAALQIARILGADTVAVVGGTHKTELARALGARAVVDKSVEPLWPAVERLAPGGFDVVLDPNGAETLLGSYRHLCPGGRLVVYGFHSMLSRGRGKPNPVKLAYDYWRTPRFDPIRMTGSNKSVMAFNLSYLFDRIALFSEAMTELMAWVAAGRLRSLPTTTYPFERVAEAHRALESGRTTGKLVLVLSGHESSA
jgi:NADPH:quinone reductase-like Zn-dependent oxidoreductase